LPILSIGHLAQRQMRPNLSAMNLDIYSSRTALPRILNLVIMTIIFIIGDRPYLPEMAFELLRWLKRPHRGDLFSGPQEVES